MPRIWMRARRRFGLEERARQRPHAARARPRRAQADPPQRRARRTRPAPPEGVARLPFRAAESGRSPGQPIAASHSRQASAHAVGRLRARSAGGTAPRQRAANGSPPSGARPFTVSANDTSRRPSARHGNSIAARHCHSGRRRQVGRRSTPRRRPAATATTTIRSARARQATIGMSASRVPRTPRRDAPHRRRSARRVPDTGGRRRPQRLPDGGRRGRRSRSRRGRRDPPSRVRAR